MPVFSNDNVINSAKAYEIDNSLRFNDDDSAHLSWTPTTAGNRKTWTWSGWVKLGNVLSSVGLFNGGASGSAEMSCTIGSNAIHIYDWNGSYVWQLSTTTKQVFRDPSAWYHFVISVDTTQGTASNRVKLYVNGSQITEFGSGKEVYPSQNHDTYFNNNQPQQIGSAFGWAKLDGHLAEIHFIDGQQLTPSDFGEFDSGYGHWKAKKFGGTHGTNGFYLDMKQDTTNDHFNTLLYTGNGSTQSITGVGFQPDLVWVKSRSSADHNTLIDSVRGGANELYANLTEAEYTGGDDGFVSLTTDGFNLDGQSSGGNSNGSSKTYAAWCWKAGGAASSNTNGSITSQVSANPDHGFSIVSYTGTGGGLTIGHGLDSAPQFVIMKDRSTTGNWFVYHHTRTYAGYNYLNTAAAGTSSGQGFFTAEPSATLLSVGSDLDVNTSGSNHIAYCWSPVAGYSKFASYTGNGSTTGPVVTTGFKVAWLLVKRTDSADSWAIFDRVRSPTNPIDDHLRADTSGAEYSPGGSPAVEVNLTNNGFEILNANAQINASSGTYIYAAFADTSVVGDATNDKSGQGNHWLPNNLATSDQVIDSPTNNFCTMNPIGETLDPTLSEGNLKMMNAGSTAWDSVLSTFAVSSGKWYWEVVSVGNTPDNTVYGIADTTEFAGNQDQFVGQTPNSWGMYSNPGATNLSYYNNGAATGLTSAPPWAVGDVLSVALDMDNGKIWWSKNGTWYHSGNPVTGAGANVSGLSGEFSPAFTAYSANLGFVANFGQDATFGGNESPSTVYDDGDYGSFFYQPPTGFKALCTQNLPDPTVKPGEHFNALTYTGTGSTQSITGAGFQPDFVWGKNRSTAGRHTLADAVRGATKNLWSERTDAEGTEANVLQAFESDGFQIGSDTRLNSNSDNYVAWNWKAGGTAVSNTNGSITSSVSANTAAGFSIVSYTGNATSGATLGHGLSSAPEMVIYKNRSVNDSDWIVYHKDIGATNYLVLNATQASGANSQYFNNTSPTASLLTIDVQYRINGSGNNLIAYCFHSVDGFSKIGSYTGNGDADGSFIYTGFQPKYVMIKMTSGESSWFIADDAREPYNPFNYGLLANSSGAELTPVKMIDLLSNGFKSRKATGYHNDSGATYIYMAFAEFPFKFATAR